MNRWLQYVIAFVIAFHGFAYLTFGMIGMREIKGWKGTSRLLGGILTADAVRTLVPPVFIIAGALIVGCAIAVIFTSLAPGWWRPLAILGSAIGIVGFAVFWDGQGKLFAQEGGIGLGASVVLLVAALVFPRAFS